MTYSPTQCEESRAAAKLSDRLRICSLATRRIEVKYISLAQGKEESIKGQGDKIKPLPLPFNPLRAIIILPSPRRKSPYALVDVSNNSD